jgi:hypothetical protein
MSAAKDSAVTDIRQSSAAPVKRSIFPVHVTPDPREPYLPSFYFTALEKAQRTGFAMQFLIDSCAPKSDTGF